MWGMMSSPTSPERSRSACGRCGSTRDSGKTRRRTGPMRRSAAMPNSRRSWRSGDEGDRGGPSDPGSHQIPRPRRPRPPAPVPRFDQRLHGAADQPDDGGVRRRRPGSATRSVTGGFSKWKMGLTDEDSYAVQLARVDLRMAMIVALVPAFKQTDDAHREALTSPFFHARLAEMPRLIAEMELAIRRRAIGEICVLAERDTLMLHGITMTGTGEMVLWQPDTLRVILAVRRLREAGVPAFFSIDTGATVYVNTLPDRADEVQKAIEELGIRTIPCEVGGPARIIGDHLF